MATVEICDICGKHINSRETKRQYKIKAKKWKLASVFTYKKGWVECAAHSSCIELLLAAKNRNITVAEIEEEVKRRFVNNDNIT